MSVTGLPGQAAGARRHPDCRSCTAGCSARIGILTALLEARASPARASGSTSSSLQARRSSCSTSRRRAALADDGVVRNRPATITRPRILDRRVPRPDDGLYELSPSTGAGSGERCCNARRTPELSHDPRLQDRGATLENRDTLNVRNRQADRATRPAPSGSKSSSKVGVPCGPIYSIDQVFADAAGSSISVSRRTSTRPDGKRVRPSSASQSQIVAHAEARSRRGRRAQRAHR